MSLPEAHRFSQVDVFACEAHRGNPVAVVHDAAGLDDEAMARFARWTNLSETTFLLPAASEAADYRLRIFTPGGELPFAGHPTLGSCHAWLEAGGLPRDAQTIVQECAAGLITIRRQAGQLAFAAPPLRRSGPMEAALLRQAIDALGLRDECVLDHQWVDNGPLWCALLLDSAATVLAVEADMVRLKGLNLGIVGAQDASHDADFEVRAFVPDLGVPEDPVTGSLNAGIAQWLIAEDIAPSRYVAAQGSRLGRAGRVSVERAGDTIWVGGVTRTLISGEARF
ncbi:MAG: PhzF family phenazine biosynthesis protein [Halieaceae bacterium]|nr:PhzF family phenazine biosynthesis protein [Halieaceae bacterium]